MHVHLSFLCDLIIFAVDNKIDGYEFKELTIEDLSRMIKPEEDKENNWEGESLYEGRIAVFYPEFFL